MSMSMVPVEHEAVATRRRRVPRSLAAPSAAGATVLVWLLADELLGLHLRQPSFGAGPPTPLSAGFVAVVGGLAAVLGWATLALSERAGRRGRRLWLFAAAAASVLSLTGPVAGHGIGVGNRLALACMHLAAAAVAIPLLYRGPAKQVTS